MPKHTDFMKKLEIIQKADWNLGDTEIGRQFGVKRYVISHLRKRLQQNRRFPNFGKSRVRLLQLAEEGKVDWTQNNREISNKHGVPYRMVADVRKQIGIKPSQRGCPKGSTWERFNRSAIDWKLTDAENAKALGVSRERIRQLRKQAGLPSSRELWCLTANVRERLKTR